MMGRTTRADACKTDGKNGPGLALNVHHPRRAKRGGDPRFLTSASWSPSQSTRISAP